MFITVGLKRYTSDSTSVYSVFEIYLHKTGTLLQLFDHPPSELTFLQESKVKNYSVLRNHPTGTEKYLKYFSSTNQ